LYDKLFYTIAYPFACLIACVWFFSFYDDYQFIDASRCEEHRGSTGRWWFRCV